MRPTRRDRVEKLLDSGFRFTHLCPPSLLVRRSQQCWGHWLNNIPPPRPSLLRSESTTVKAHQWARERWQARHPHGRGRLTSLKILVLDHITPNLKGKIALRYREKVWRTSTRFSAGRSGRLAFVRFEVYTANNPVIISGRQLSFGVRRGEGQNENVFGDWLVLSSAVDPRPRAGAARGLGAPIILHRAAGSSHRPQRVAG